MSVAKDTPSNMTVEMFGFLQDTDFNVPEVSGTPTISDTKMEIDSNDINQNGNSEESRITSGNHYILNTSNHLKISKKLRVIAIKNTADWQMPQQIPLFRINCHWKMIQMKK